MWTEKLALFHIIKPTVDDLSKDFAVRGYSSVTALADYAERAVESNNPTILYFGDLDVNGMGTPETILESLKYEHGLKDFEIIRYGLDPNQTVNLNASPVPLKGKQKQKNHFMSTMEIRLMNWTPLSRMSFSVLFIIRWQTFTDMESLRRWKRKQVKKTGKSLTICSITLKSTHGYWRSIAD